MNIKEAIAILTQFQCIAGENARCDIGKLRLIADVNVTYYPGPYAFSDERTREKSRDIVYSVTCEQEQKFENKQYATPYTNIE